ncbi:MAG: hypothetical protein HDT21_06980 [Ruminococcus sp.]|nr:hypothetical protein [Ruminococcus sp.]
MYVRLDGGVVAEVIPDIDPAFPDVPIGERYPADFIAELMHVTDGAAVEVGMEYNAETDSFGYPVSAAVPDLSEDEPIEETSGISQAEINLDFEYRLSCIELGIG